MSPAAPVVVAEVPCTAATGSRPCPAAVIDAPPLHDVFRTATLDPAQLLLLLPFPVVVWGVDELVRWVRRGRAGSAHHRPG